MRIFLFTFFISFHAISVVPVDDCQQPIDELRTDHEMGNFWKTPRNQDGMGWCYAYPAADLLSASIRRPASAAYVSYQYNDQATWDFSWIWRFVGVPDSAMEVEEGGFGKLSLEYAKKNGICPESVLPSDSQHIINSHSALKQAMLDLVELKKIIEEKKLSRQAFKDCVDCQRKIDNHSGIQNFFPKIKSNDLYDIIKAHSSNSINTMIYQLAEKFCVGKKINFPSQQNINVRVHNKNKSDQTFALIDSLLRKKKPVAFSTELGLIDDSRPGQHAMSIIAREFRNGECKYLVRNSWGRGCSYYPIEEVSKDCLPDQGAMWISKKRLNRFIEEITYVD